MAKIKTVEIKEVEKETIKEYDFLTELERADIALGEIHDALTLVINFFEQQHRADLKDPLSCWDLVNFTQRYNTVLKMARDKVDNLNADIKEVVKEF
ncbi:MAG: hypothetical protein Q3988_05590 [Gemella sp.]|nr:hypothetical protein [Gemella sp.]